MDSDGTCANSQPVGAIRTADNTDGKSRKSIVSEKSPSFRPAHPRVARCTNVNRGGQGKPPTSKARAARGRVACEWALNQCQSVSTVTLSLTLRVWLSLSWESLTLWVTVSVCLSVTVSVWMKLMRRTLLETTALIVITRWLPVPRACWAGWNPYPWKST